MNSRSRLILNMALNKEPEEVNSDDMGRRDVEKTLCKSDNNNYRSDRVYLNFMLLRLVKKKYRPFPFPNVTLDLCDEYLKLGEKNPFGIRTAILKSNFRGCPCPVGLHYLYNWVLEEKNFLHIYHQVNTNWPYMSGLMIICIFLLSGAWYGSILKKQKR